MSAKHIQEMQWVINSIQKWFPEDQRKSLKKQASKNYAEYAMVIANSVWHNTGNRKITHKLMMETAKMYFNKEIASQMVKIYAKMLINRR
jgi:hypothetical protein